jgi:hypothetical protein
MNANELLSQITITTPCSERWDTTPRNDRLRFCEARRNRVHNIATLTSEEAIGLILAADETSAPNSSCPSTVRW